MGKHLQLLMQVDAFLPNGDGKKLFVLVDTGAQANLIRSDLVPYHLTFNARTPVRLVAANQQLMIGGDRTVCLQLGFNQVRRG